MYYGKVHEPWPYWPMMPWTHRLGRGGLGAAAPREAGGLGGRRPSNGRAKIIATNWQANLPQN